MRIAFVSTRGIPNNYGGFSHYEQILLTVVRPALNEGDDRLRRFDLPYCQYNRPNNQSGILLSLPISILSAAT